MQTDSDWSSISISIKNQKVQFRPGCGGPIHNNLTWSRSIRAIQCLKGESTSRLDLADRSMIINVKSCNDKLHPSTRPPHHDLSGGRW